MLAYVLHQVCFQLLQSHVWGEKKVTFFFIFLLLILLQFFRVQTQGFFLLFFGRSREKKASIFLLPKKMVESEHLARARLRIRGRP